MTRRQTLVTLASAVLAEFKGKCKVLPEAMPDSSKLYYSIHGTFIEEYHGQCFWAASPAEFAEKLHAYRQKYGYVGPVDCHERLGELDTYPRRSWVDRGFGSYPYPEGAGRNDRYYLSCHPFSTPAGPGGPGGWTGGPTASLDEDLGDFISSARKKLMVWTPLPEQPPLCWSIETWVERIRFKTSWWGGVFGNGTGDVKTIECFYAGKCLSPDPLNWDFKNAEYVRSGDTELEAVRKLIPDMFAKRG